MMQFEAGEHTITLVGDASLIHSKISLKAMLKTLRKEKQGFYVELNTVETNWERDNNKEGVTSGIPAVLQEVIERNAEVFEAKLGLSPERGHEHAILLKEGMNPVGVRPYRYPQCQKDEIEKLIQEMLEAGIIRPSSSPYSSPVLLVKKRDGSWRFCVDYMALNKETILDKFLIPVIEELLDELHEATIFSKLDLKAGYHQIRVRSQDTPKMAFRTYAGHYEFLVLPFGLMNGPATFQSLMNDVLRPFLRRFALVFFDDILVYSKTLGEHCKNLDMVLKTLVQNQLVVNHKKCDFGKERVDYLGHEVSAQGVAGDTEKIKAIMEWKPPKNLKETWVFGTQGLLQEICIKIRTYCSPIN